MSPPSIAIPGQALASSTTYTPGPGTQLSDNTSSSNPPAQNKQARTLSAAIFGRPTITNASTRKGLSILSVQQTPARNTKWTPPMLPEVGMTVYARVTRVTITNVICSILVLGPTVDALNNTPSTASSAERSLHPLARNLTALSHPFRGILRPPDVRLTQKDTVVLSQCFRVGDIIRAAVISMGDQGGYYLSTAGNEFGVVMAWSERGVVCGPASWKEVVEIGEEEEIGNRRREGRKVAKVW